MRLNDLEILNEESSWIAVWVSEVEMAKLLLRTEVVMTSNRGNLVPFRLITNK